MSNKTNNLPNLVPLVWAALFTALIAAGAYLTIPFPGIPFVLANFFVALSGLVLGPFWGAFSVLLYLGLGALNLPVFAGGAGGIAHFFGATGGFLLGYIPCVFLIGLIRDPVGKSFLRNALAVLAGFTVLYLAGIPVLALYTDHDLVKALVRMLPFLGVDLLKAAFAVVLTRLLFSGIPKLAHPKK